MPFEQGLVRSGTSVVGLEGVEVRENQVSPAVPWSLAWEEDLGRAVALRVVVEATSQRTFGAWRLGEVGYRVCCECWALTSRVFSCLVFWSACSRHGEVRWSLEGNLSGGGDTIFDAGPVVEAGQLLPRGRSPPACSAHFALGVCTCDDVVIRVF